MREDRAHLYWCPQARVNLQRVKQGGGGVEALPASGYNRSTIATNGLDDVVRGACGCLGRECAAWRGSGWNLLRWLPILGHLFPRRGRCGLAGG